MAKDSARRVVYRTGHEHLSYDQAATPGVSSVAAAGQGPAPEPARSSPPCFEIERRQLTAFDLSPEFVDLILTARHPSTKSVYTCRWDTFVVWCGT